MKKVCHSTPLGCWMHAGEKNYENKVTWFKFRPTDCIMLNKKGIVR